MTTGANRFLAGLQNSNREENNLQQTLNGAFGHATANNTLVDMNFKVHSYRNDEITLEQDFKNALVYSPEYAIKFMFYLRDARAGLGERESFRRMLKIVADSGIIEPSVDFVRLLPEYGRWDDIFVLYEVPQWKYVVLLVIREQLEEDFLASLDEATPVSLLAKWMPSENASSQRTKALARSLRKDLKIPPKQYRQLLSKLRERIDVTERKMSSNQWSNIDYNTVPSRANRLYANAFMEHDSERRIAHLNNAISTDSVAKVNSAMLYPYEIISQIQSTPLQILNKYTHSVRLDILSQWKHLPKLIEPNESTLVVLDTSGSMGVAVGKDSQTSALTVATSLAIYCAEALIGAYKDKVITFSSSPKYIDLSDCDTVIEKVERISHYSLIENTDIEKTFDLILATALQNNLEQSELPRNILILSDMEFDEARSEYPRIERQTLFDTISAKFQRYGYIMPHLIFWNICGETNTMPDHGEHVSLISGFSPNAMKVALSGKGDNWEQLKTVLDSPRYEGVCYLPSTNILVLRRIVNEEIFANR